MAAEPGSGGPEAAGHGSRPKPGGPQPGALLELEVRGLDVHGDGVARTEDGLVVFVPGALPGDRIRVRVTKRAASYARAGLVDLREASLQRVVPPCPVVEACGGCPLMGLAYPTQLEHKRRLVVDALQRIGGFEQAEELVRPTAGMEGPYRYRNKAQYPVVSGPDGRVQLGFYRRGTHQVVPIDDCAVQHPTNCALARSAPEILEALGLAPYDEQADRGMVRHLICRTAEASGEALVVVVTRQPEPVEPLRALAARLAEEVPSLVGVAQNVNPQRTNVVLGPVTRTVRGRPWIEERVGHLTLRLSPTAFFQVNTRQARRLYQEVRSAVEALVKEERGAGRPGPARGGVELVDVYCGVGGIGLYCADRVDRVTGIEEVAQAVEDARANARLNGVRHAAFVRASAAQALAELARERARRPGRRVVVVDPPRRGVESPVLGAIVEMAPEGLIYVSCNPATLARDLRQLVRLASSRGLRYRPGPVQPVDMFPHTAHVEAVAVLYRA